MTIITWNCNMAFRKKAAAVLKYSPDILVIQECEQPDKLNDIFREAAPTSSLWFGENPHKGLGIFSFNGFRLTTHKTHNRELKIIAPLSVRKNEIKFTLFAIWAHNPGDPDGQYITQVWKALQQYRRLIRKTGTILIGDFNSNTIWDKPRREGNHTTVVSKLQQKGIESLYHTKFAQRQGSEEHPTLYLYRHQDKPYHIDYCFASADLIDQLHSIEIGRFEEWKELSDHTPVIVKFNSF